MDISVIIPLYNKAPHIKRAIDSILNQTIPVGEVIVVDDGSTDGGGKIVEAITDPRLRLIRQVNCGQHAARNRGTTEASNPFVGFLDADDEWKPDFLIHILRLMTNFPDCGAYATSAQIIKPDGKIVYPKLVDIPPEPWIGIIPNFFILFQAGFAFNCSSIVINKKILQEVGGFPVDTTYSGDVACWVKIAIRYPIAFSPTRSIIYHQEAQNRVGPKYEFLNEMPAIQIIREAIDSGVIPKELQPDALEYSAQKQIEIAVYNVMAGNPHKARQLLATCKHTKKYMSDWLWWRMWASLPAGWPLRILQAKKLLQGKLR